MPISICLNCSKQFKSHHGNFGKFCNQTCMGEHTRKQTYQRFLEGNVKDRGTLRKILHEQKPECWECGISKWQGKILSLELDHIDGNAGNNIPSNIRLLCPNCHSTTPTWKARNKGNGRAFRNLPLY